MRKILFTICSIRATAVLLLLFSGCDAVESSSSNDSSLNEVTIGEQVWMTKNLDVSSFRNEDPIPEARTAEEWNRANEEKRPAWCYYDNDPANKTKYGRLYNWYAVNDPRGLAPSGYHVPSDEEWTVLTDYLGGDEVAGDKMKSKTGWSREGNGTNSSGFSGLPAGIRDFDETFSGEGLGGFWWSSTMIGELSAWTRSISHTANGNAYRFIIVKNCGLSVRCLRD